MATYLDTDIRDAAIDGACAELDTETGTYPTLRLQTAGDVDLVVINLDTTRAVAAASGGSAVLNPPDGEASWTGYSINPIADGTIGKAILTDRSATGRLELSVGASGSGEEVEVAQLAVTTALDMTFAAAPTVTQIAAYDPTP